ncbi:MAG: Rpn family recombination-promoting nuclease/putative transposase [Bacteroidaceae bacterium]|nr:Rpn family recombination-promoting nuclease/putative transposase [Bacteroidaceae bacterium]
MKGKYLNPKADVTFKKIFGEHPHLVKSLLNALLPFEDGKQIESVEYLTTELVPENPVKKNSVVDVRCRETGGRHFIVEMQMNWNNEFKQRVILNASKAVVKQLDKGEDYTLLQPVYSLNLINYAGFEAEQDDFYHDYAIINVTHNDRIIDGLRFVFVELPKFFTSKQQGRRMPKPIALRRMAVLWLRFLTEIDEKTEVVDTELLENPDTSHALQILEKSAYTESQLYAYEQFWDAVVNERVSIEGGFKKGMAKGLEEGLEEGLAKGLAEGREKGLAEGRAEGLAKGRAEEKLDNARKMKAKGYSLADIADITGLTPEEIERL